VNHRERHLAVLRGEPVDRVPDFEFGAWTETIVRWHNEGLPAEYKGEDRAMVDWFHLDDEEFGPSPYVNIGACPGFQARVLESKGDCDIVLDWDGATCEQMKPGRGVSIPRYLRFAIETKEDWKKMRDERLDWRNPDRIPKDLEELCKRSFTADYPVTMWTGSMYGWLRNWIGVENFSMLFIEDPEWVEEMMEHITQLAEKVLAKLAGKCKIDRMDWWEDMCYKDGSLLSPEMFKRLMVPRYKRITSLLREGCGCGFNMVDCDGKIHQLVGLWLEAGINVMFPLEAAHTDAFRISDEFGKKVALRGYVDKIPLIRGPEAIDREMEKLARLMKRGNIIPHVDHRVPPDVSFENYRHYRRKKCELIGKKYREGR